MKIKEMNNFDYWIIELLKSYNLIDSIQSVHSVIWFPVKPYCIYTCAIRVSFKRYDAYEYNEGIIKKACYMGNYINLVLDEYEFVKKTISSINEDELLKHIKPLSDRHIIVEHTSLTPVYPLNIATFRGSVIGNALAKTCEMFGADVETHYLVSDRARNVDLLLNNFPTEDIIVYKNAKPDHLCGQLYCMALNNIGKTINDIDIKRMFPYASINSSFPINHTPISNEDRKKYCEFCVSGHLSTLNESEINIQKFDYESDIIRDYQDDITLLNNTNISKKQNYLLNNIIYFSTLSKLQKDRVFSVINHRQETVITKSISFVSDYHIIFPLFYNDVHFTNSTCNSDSIKNGVFHSVDEYVDRAIKHLQEDKAIIYKALKLLLLSVKNRETIILNDCNFIELKKYIEIINFISCFEKVPIGINISHLDVLLSKKIIYFTHLISIDLINIDNTYTTFDIHKILYVIEEIIALLKTCCENKTPIYKDLYKTCFSIIKYGFGLMGISI